MNSPAPCAPRRAVPHDPGRLSRRVPPAVKRGDRLPSSAEGQRRLRRPLRGREGPRGPVPPPPLPAALPPLPRPPPPPLPCSCGCCPTCGGARPPPAGAGPPAARGAPQRPPRRRRRPRCRARRGWWCAAAAWWAPRWPTTSPSWAGGTWCCWSRAGRGCGLQRGGPGGVPPGVSGISVAVSGVPVFISVVSAATLSAAAGVGSDRPSLTELGAASRHRATGSPALPGVK